MRHKVGLYIRVSTEEQAARSEGSLDTQRHRMESFVEIKNMTDPAWGKIVEAYIDDGYSAKDVRRPAYQRLMNDVRKGKINLILVTDVSRLSRNMLDFCNLLEDLKKFKAKYLSIKENFDTSTSAGELMIKTMMTLNEFERKQTAERVATNFHARALRGLRNGGRVLFGFDKNPDDLARLSINDVEASEIREVFRTYLSEGTCGATVKKLNTIGILRKTKHHHNDCIVESKPWTRNSLLLVLRNPAYAGLREINKRHRKEDQQTLKSIEKYQLVKASWPAIVSEQDWAATQQSLDFSLSKERGRLNQAKIRSFLLTGTLRCGECGDRLMGSTAHGRNQEHRYYVHSKTKGRTEKCSLDWMPAIKLEEAVTGYLDQVLEKQGFLDKIELDVEKSNIGRNRDLIVARTKAVEELAVVEASIKKSIRLQSDCVDPSLDEIYRDNLKGLADEKRRLKILLDEIESLTNNDIEPKAVRNSIEYNIHEFRRAWKKAKPIIQKRLLAAVFERIELSATGLELHYFVEGATAPSGPKKGVRGPEVASSLGITKNQNVVSLPDRRLGKNVFGPSETGSWDQSISGSDIDEIGRGGGIRTHDLFVPNEAR
jgi:site-specific DNA recombinase